MEGKDHNGFPIRTKEEMAAFFVIKHKEEPNDKGKKKTLKVIENHMSDEFVQQYRERNLDVRLDHIEIKSDERQGQTPLICVHGMFDSRLSFKQICEKEEVLAKRDCYLVGTRNHAFSDHHDDMDYTVMANDIIRFADE